MCCVCVSFRGSPHACFDGCLRRVVEKRCAAGETLWLRRGSARSRCGGRNRQWTTTGLGLRTEWSSAMSTGLPLRLFRGL